MKIDPTVLADLESVSLEELEAAAEILRRAQEETDAHRAE